MVTFQVQVPEANEEAFVNIIRSLQSLGVITSFNTPGTLAGPGAPVPIENLLELLEGSEKQIAAGDFVPGEKVKDIVRLWQASR